MVELVHYRDPDDECRSTLLINGVIVPIDEIFDIDPGRSESIEEWKEARDALHTSQRGTNAARMVARDAWSDVIADHLTR